jgi:hypothetical protein
MKTEKSKIIARQAFSDIEKIFRVLARKGLIVDFNYQNREYFEDDKDDIPQKLKGESISITILIGDLEKNYFFDFDNYNLEKYKELRQDYWILIGKVKAE